MAPGREPLANEQHIEQLVAHDGKTLVALGCNPDVIEANGNAAMEQRLDSELAIVELVPNDSFHLCDLLIGIHGVVVNA